MRGPLATDSLPRMSKKLYIETHGCQMNEYDSSRMVDLLGEREPLEVTQNPAEADVILLNTCSIRERAQDRVYSQLGRWRELKLANPEMVIAVGGCVASQEGAAIRDRAPYVDVVFGPQTLADHCRYRRCDPGQPRGSRCGRRLVRQLLLRFGAALDSRRELHRHCAVDAGPGQDGRR